MVAVPLAEDGPWTVGVIENTHDPSSYTLYVWAHTRNLTLTRSSREIIELHRQLRAAYPAVPRPAFPFRSSALVQSAKQTPTIHPTSPRLTSPAEGTCNDSRCPITITHSAHIQVPVEKSVSANTTNIALAWYLTALSNDPVFRRVPPWKNFMRVRAEDLESTFVNAVTAAAMEKSTSLDGTIERGSRESSSDEDGSSVNVSDERRTPPMPSNSATPTKEGALLNMQVSDFQMVCVLGIGSRGKVLLAHHKSSSNLYALKVIAKRRVLASHDVQRTLTEQAVLSRMAIDGTTQFMAKLRRSFHDEDNLYLAMDFYPGGDLRTQLDRWGSFNHERSRFYAAEVVDGIEGLHSLGVIHRNLKPEHILIDKGGHIVLCGFGKSKEFRRSTAQPAPSGNPSAGGVPYWMNCSKENTPSLQSDRADRTSSLCGTAAYFAPEVIMGLPYSYEIDWWSLGTILYEMLTGIRPFDADNMSDMYDRILQDELKFPEGEPVDRHTKDFIQGLLQRDPGSRLSEPQIKRHPYFLMIDWSDVHYLGCKPPYIPPTDSSNLGDTQNFEQAFLNMEPVINDEIYVDMAQEERGEVNLEPRGGEDLIATPSQPRISLAYPPDDTDDVFEGYSFNDQRSIVINEEVVVPGKDKEAREEGKTEAEMSLGRNDLTKQTVLLKEALRSFTPPVQQRPPEPPPVYSDTNPAPFPTATLLAIPDIPAQVPASPSTSPTDVVGNAARAALAHHHQTFRPKSSPRQRNFRRTRQEKTLIPVSELDHRSEDEDENEEEDMNHGEGLDNCQSNIVNVDRGNHNGPRSIKTLSKHSFSTTKSSASLRTASSKNTSIPR